MGCASNVSRVLGFVAFSGESESWVDCLPDGLLDIAIAPVPLGAFEPLVYCTCGVWLCCNGSPRMVKGLFVRVVLLIWNMNEKGRLLYDVKLVILTSCKRYSKLPNCFGVGYCFWALKFANHYSQ